MATFGHPSDDVGLRELMSRSPDAQAHMSVAAELTFLLGVASLLVAPFSALFAVTLVAAVAASCSGIAGMITTRGPNIAGGALSAVGLFAAVAAAVLVGLRYLGLDTAFGDDLAPGLWEQVQRWSSRLPQPSTT
jgi:hypothetical protein